MGIKRAALLGIGLLLGLNGWRLAAGQAAATIVIFSSAGGDWAADDLAAWLRERMRRR